VVWCCSTVEIFDSGYSGFLRYCFHAARFYPCLPEVGTLLLGAGTYIIINGGLAIGYTEEQTAILKTQCCTGFRYATVLSKHNHFDKRASCAASLSYCRVSLIRSFISCIVNSTRVQ